MKLDPTKTDFTASWLFLAQTNENAF